MIATSTQQNVTCIYMESIPIMSAVVLTTITDEYAQQLLSGAIEHEGINHDLDIARKQRHGPRLAREV